MDFRFVVQPNGVVMLEKGPIMYNVYAQFVTGGTMPNVRSALPNLAVVCPLLGDYHRYFIDEVFVAQYSFQSGNRL